MPDNFSAAAVRHLRDATHLSGVGRLGNADHLAGIAAECALKVALVGKGIAVLPGKDKLHLDKLWSVMPLQKLGGRHPNLVLLLRQAPPPFADWSIDQRYADGVNIDQARVDRHLEAARRIAGAVGLLGERGTA